MENELPRRKSPRLKEFDYSTSAYYFVTICVTDMQNLLGKVDDGKMLLNKYGQIAKERWDDLPNHYINCELDYYVIMPNHVHGIIIIDNSRIEVTAHPEKAIHSLSEIVRGFKTFSSKKINLERTEGKFLWQKSFYDRIIRNEKELYRIRKYIEQNPLKWEIEKNMPVNLEI